MRDGFKGILRRHLTREKGFHAKFQRRFSISLEATTHENFMHIHRQKERQDGTDETAILCLHISSQRNSKHDGKNNSN